MASDAQRQQSEMYWRGAQPIAITEWAAKTLASDGSTRLYFRVRNSGAYPISITGIVGADGAKATTFWSTAGVCGLAAGNYNISSYYSLAPGEEKYFGSDNAFGLSCDREISAGSGSSGGIVGNAVSLCANSTTVPGTLTFNSMGFEYTEYIEGQQITKREIGKQVTIKCLPAQ